MKESIDFKSENRYINFILEVYDWIFFSNYINDIDEIKESRKKKIFHKKKDDEFLDIVINENVFNNAIKRYREDIYRKSSGNDFSFGNLFNVCQFIRFSEKCLLYVNNINKMIYVDSDLYSKNEHRMQILDNGVDIYIKLNTIYESIQDTTLYSINIKVIHNTGKKLTNDFIIVNDNPKFNDDSDRYLFYSVKNIFRKNFTKVMDEIIGNLKKIYDENLRSV